MSKIIVGVDESPGSADAIALASSLAGMTGATLMLVNVFPYDDHPSRAVNAEYETYHPAGQHRVARASARRQRRRVRGDPRDPEPVARARASRAGREDRRQPDRGRLDAHGPRRARPPRQHRRAAPARLAVPGRRGAEELRTRDAPRAHHRLRLRRIPASERALESPTASRPPLAHACASSAASAPRLQSAAVEGRAMGGLPTTTPADRATAELDEAVAKLEGDPARRAVLRRRQPGRDPRPRRPRSSASSSSAPVATARCTPCWWAGSPAASCARPPAP